MRSERRSVLNEFLDRTERRRHARFLLDADVKVISDRVGLLPGQSFDISESGMSVLLPIELSLGEGVRLIFSLPMGSVEVNAFVRSRNAFRHGFEFVAEDASQVLIRRSCEFLTPCPYEN
jgi:PilZ domain-containing protein